MSKTIVINNILEAKTLKEKITGLLSSPNPKPLFFATRWGIHTFGMKYAIDVIVLDDQYTVRALKPNLKPNLIFLWNPKWKYVLELPAGTIDKKIIVIGNRVKIYS